jgi:hydrogenase expression/formation protein HypE
LKENNSPESFLNCPLPLAGADTIQIGHGSGGQMMNDLIRELFLKAFDNSYLNQLNDQAVIEVNGVRLALSTDSFVVDPLFFPGGNIGDLAVNGTVNDVCMSGARPLFLSVAMILEEGFPLQELQLIVESMKIAADRAGVLIVTGDTKVVNKGQCDKLFINTTGLGVIEHSFAFSANNLQAGDQIILSGSIGDHGITILSKREGLSFDAPIESDTIALNSLVAEILKVGGPDVHAMRDPTRGGVAAIMNEFASSSQVGIHLYEECIPIKPAVAGACEMLGLDPLYIANEGKLVTSVSPDGAEKVLQAMRAHLLAREAAIIGKVVAERPGLVIMQTRIGGRRIVDMPISEPLPRIC